MQCTAIINQSWISINGIKFNDFHNEQGFHSNERVEVKCSECLFMHFLIYPRFVLKNNCFKFIMPNSGSMPIPIFIK